MGNNKRNMIMQNKRIIGIVFSVMLILFVPLIAMLFTDEVKWTLFDFIIAAVLLLGTGSMCELVIRKVKIVKYRIAICITLIAAVALVWAELAVGIIDSSI